MTLAKEAWIFVLPFLALAGLAWLASWPRSAVGLLVTAIAVAAFFRVPARSYNGPDDLILAAANGVVTAVDEVAVPELNGRTHRRIVTFLSVFNVHVQRAPIAGTVRSSTFRPGRKVAAFRPDAGDVNESHFVTLETTGGGVLGVKQIAGLLARRIVNDLRPGDRVVRGQRIGLIKFGSRVDLFLPIDAEILVGEGDRLVEGLTEVARLQTPGAAEGEAS